MIGREITNLLFSGTRFEEEFESEDNIHSLLDGIPVFAREFYYPALYTLMRIIRIQIFVIFLLSTLQNPNRHALARPQAKVEKIYKISKSIPSPKTVVIFVLSLLKNPNKHVRASP
ncbi:hypothetical protein Y032_0656g1214 [Ancylostoma ceylanicum]|uniref:Uncharacterized protein n=1 Tax=Ancylostoma ceylanicum TaxID=53326 RepID=A0A016WHZ8_9BILA|nr:hypothetical protein Y032_0656g1214 [Ancylostoma ceylanicum]